ncbi:hypothetical protein F4809DRAFT_177157 [Biscogniauxia mediterranea]|nr:hypothetical protein F4809DRAFT_177157 [Biscogniauxia mediterranea]
MDLSTKKHVGPVQSELEQTRDTLRRTQKYLAKARKDLIDLGVDVEVYKQEGWVSTRARKRRERRQKLLEKEAAEDEIRATERRRLRGELKKLGEWVTPSPTASEAERNEQNQLISDQLRLASYKDRIRRSSAQLLIASAVGYQYRETTVAMRSGKLVDGADPAIPRRYRAFENRRTSSLSSTEFAARAFKNWINREKDLRGRSRSRSPSTVGPSSRSSSTSTTTTTNSTNSSGTSITNFYIDTLFRAPRSDSLSDYGINTLHKSPSISDYGLDNLYSTPSTSNDSNFDEGSSGSSSSSSSDESFDWMIGAHETFDPDEFNSNTLIVAQAMMAQATSLPGSGSWMSKLASLSGMKNS